MYFSDQNSHSIPWLPVLNHGAVRKLVNTCWKKKGSICLGFLTQTPDFSQFFFFKIFICSPLLLAALTCLMLRATPAPNKAVVQLLCSQFAVDKVPVLVSAVFLFIFAHEMRPLDSGVSSIPGLFCEVIEHLPWVRDGGWLFCRQIWKNTDFLLMRAFNDLPGKPAGITRFHTQPQARSSCHAGWCHLQPSGIS